MSDTLQRVREPVRAGTVKISEYGYDELAADGISAREMVEGLQDALPIEEYPSLAGGPCVLACRVFFDPGVENTMQAQGEKDKHSEVARHRHSVLQFLTSCVSQRARSPGVP